MLEVVERVITASATKEVEAAISKLCGSFLRKPVTGNDLIREMIKYLPHTIIPIDRDKGSVDVASHQLPLKIPAEYAELIKLIANQQQRCQSLGKLMAIKQITLFAKDIKDLASQFDYEPLDTWAINFTQQ